MTDLLRLLFLVPLGYIAAVLAAAFTILAGWYGHEAGAILADVVATGQVMGVGVWVVLQVGAVAVVPAFIVVVLAELFGWRSLIFYLAVGGALGLLTSQLHGIVWETGNSQLLLSAAGFVGAFVYWLVAGRLAGFDRAPEPPPPAGRPTSPG